MYNKRLDIYLILDYAPVTKELVRWNVNYFLCLNDLGGVINYVNSS